MDSYLPFNPPAYAAMRGAWLRVADGLLPVPEALVRFAGWRAAQLRPRVKALVRAFVGLGANRN